MPTEITIGADTYRIGKMNAMKQWHVTRRLLPVAMAVGDGLSELMRKEAAASEKDQLADFDIMTTFKPMLEAYSKLSDEDSEYIIYTCMEAVERKSGDGWAQVKNPAARVLQFQDIEMRDLLKLTLAVCREHRLMDFTVVLPDAPT